MDLGLTGKRALVMSSSRGLGLGIAEALAAEGTDVFLTGRSEDSLGNAAERINARGTGKAAWVAADLGDAAPVEKVTKAAQEAMGGVDILLANTGGPPPGRMADADLAVLARQFDMMVMRWQRSPTLSYRE